MHTHSPTTLRYNLTQNYLEVVAAKKGSHPNTVRLIDGIIYKSTGYRVSSVRILRNRTVLDHILSFDILLGKVPT